MTDAEAREMARELVRGSIVEDAVSQFIAQVLKHAHDERIKPLRKQVADLEAKLAKAVEALGRVKMSIENGGGGGVVDVVWLDDPCPETLCDFIDATLAEIKGESHD